MDLELEPEELSDFGFYYHKYVNTYVKKNKPKKSKEYYREYHRKYMMQVRLLKKTKYINQLEAQGATISSQADINIGQTINEAPQAFNDEI